MAPTRPTVYILSDSLGETAEHMAHAALSLFDEETFHVVRLPRISSRGQLEGVIKGANCGNCVFVYTLAEPKLRDAMDRIQEVLPIGAVDLLGPLVGAMANAAHESPEWRSGEYRRTDGEYFERVDALDFAVQHDDGRNTEELDQAEIVLIGVSRTSKTPLSMYLAFKGYRVANVPLVPGSDPPPQIFEVDSWRMFGLVTDIDLLAEIRRQRLADLGPYARTYADRESVRDELQESRVLMRRLGCIVVQTGNRAIEETAQEILAHFECAVPAGETVRVAPEGMSPPVPRRRPRKPLPRAGD
jgi:regulator of PEP synthase PpsR (kinase-PPPase family)